MANEIYSSSWWGIGACNEVGWGIVYKQYANCGPVPGIIADFTARVIADGGTVESEACLDVPLTFLTTNGPATSDFTGLLDTYSGAAAAYSLRQLSSTYSGDAIRVRRSSDNAEQNIGFVSNELDTATLETFVKSGNVFANPDITSASSWTIGNSTTYNAATEAFDLSSENGLTVRQGKSVANHTYTITIVLGSVTSGGIKIYAGGTQSAVISTAGTHTLNITAGSSNDILGINPNGTATCSISSFYAVDTTADGFVAIWYDQSGNAVNAANATASQQPQIVSGGTSLGYIQNKITNNATLDANYFYNQSNYSVFSVVENFGSAAFGGTNNSGIVYGLSSNGSASAATIGFANPSYYSNSISIGLTRDDLFQATSSFNELTSLFDGANYSVSFGYKASSSFNSCRYKEYIIYPNQTISRTGVEDNIITHYGF